MAARSRDVRFASARRVRASAALLWSRYVLKWVFSFLLRFAPSGAQPTFQVGAGGKSYDGGLRVLGRRRRARRRVPEVRSVSGSNLFSASHARRVEPVPMETALAEALSVMLADNNGHVLSVASRSLLTLGLSKAEAATALIRNLEAEDKELRGAAVGWLGLLGNATSHDVVSSLRFVVRQDAEVNVRQNAGDALLAIGSAGGPQAITALRSVLEASQDYQLQRRSVLELRRLVDGIGRVEAVVALCIGLNLTGGYTRGEASHSLGQLGDAAADALFSLSSSNSTEAIWALELMLRFCGECSMEHTMEAICMLHKVGVPGAWRLLVMIVSSQEFPHARLVAIEALGSAFMDAQACDLLLSALQDTDAKVRAAAAQALAHCGDIAELHLVTGLHWSVADSDATVSTAVAKTLLSFAASGGHVAVRALRAAIESPAWHNCRAAAWSLTSLSRAGSVEALAALRSTLGCSSWKARQLAVEALGSLGDALELGDVAALFLASVDAEPHVRKACAKALGALSEIPRQEHQGAVVVLERALYDADIGVRRAATDSLLSIGQARGVDAGAALRALLGGDSLYASQAAKTIGAHPELLDPQTSVAMCSALRSEDLNLRRAAAEAFGKASYANAAGMVSSLHVALMDQDDVVRRASGQALLSLGLSEGPVSSTALRFVLESEIGELRQKAATALMSQGQESVTFFHMALASESRFARQAAAQSLASLGPAAGKDSVAALCRSLSDRDGIVRTESARALGSLGEAADVQVVVALQAALQDNDVNVRDAAAEALLSVGQMLGAVGIAALRAMLDSDKRKMQHTAVRALATLAQDGTAEALAPLHEALKSKGWGQRKKRRMVANALGSLLKACGPESTLVLCSALNDEYIHVRQGVAEALGSLGGSAGADVVAALRSALHDQNAQVRRAAAAALLDLGRAGGPHALVALRAALTSDEWYMQQAAALSLASLGEEVVDETLTELLAKLRGNDAANDRSITRALQGMCSASRGNVSSLMLDRLRHGDRLERQACATAIGAFSDFAEGAAVEALQRALNDESEDVRRAAAEALLRVGRGRGPEAVPALEAVLASPFWHLRQAASELVGSIDEGSED